MTTSESSLAALAEWGAAESGDIDGGRFARGHWALVLPASVIGAIYFTAWGLLVAAGEGGGELARLALLVGVVAPPLIGAHAFFRYESVCLGVVDNEVVVNRGGFGSDTETISVGEIADITVWRGLLTGATGMATVRLRLKCGRIVDVPGLAEPDDVVAEISTLTLNGAM